MSRTYDPPLSYRPIFRITPPLPSASVFINPYLPVRMLKIPPSLGVDPAVHLKICKQFESNLLVGFEVKFCKGSFKTAFTNDISKFYQICTTPLPLSANFNGCLSAFLSTFRPHAFLYVLMSFVKDILNCCENFFTCHFDFVSHFFSLSSDTSFHLQARNFDRQTCVCAMNRLQRGIFHDDDKYMTSRKLPRFLYIHILGPLCFHLKTSIYPTVHSLQILPYPYL